MIRTLRYSYRSHIVLFPLNSTCKLNQTIIKFNEALRISCFFSSLPGVDDLPAMEASRQQLQSCRESQGTRPVLEEFIPLKNSSAEGLSDQKPAPVSDKANWMTSAQLWSQAGDKQQQQSTSSKTEGDHISFNVSPKLGLDTKQRNGGAFLPFTKERSSAGPNNSTLRAIPELALASSDREREEKQCGESENRMNGSRGEISGKGGSELVAKAVESQATTTTTSTTTTTTTTQTHRKARRCWSPDLHRRFVNALQMLGGSQGKFTVHNFWVELANHYIQPTDFQQKSFKQ